MNERDYREGRVRVSKPIEESLIELIKQEDDIAKKKKHPAKWYRDEVAKFLKLSERDNPSLRSYEDKISYFRERLRIKNPLDAPWSIAASLKYGISPEATADLINVWKYCLAIGHTFTIREAKWVALIRTAIQTSRNVYQYRGALLFGYANEYAIRERISEILSSPMDTRDIDGNLCFQERDWDWVVFRAIGMIPRLTTKYYNKELSEYNLFSIYINAASYIAEQNMPEVDPNRIISLASELSEKQAYMFAALLSYLSKGPLWREISTRVEYLSILDYLTDLVTKELVDDLETSFHTKTSYKELDVSHSRDRPNGLAPEDVLSPDLLKLVGYEVATHTQTVDKPYPHLKNYPERTRYKAVFTLSRNKQEGGTK